MTERTTEERYVLGAVARHEVFRDWNGLDYRWPTGNEPAQPLTDEEQQILDHLIDDGLVRFGGKQVDGRTWCEPTKVAWTWTTRPAS